MRDFIEAAAAVWPWWTAPFLIIWWTSLVSASREAPDDDPLATARNCVSALTVVVTIAWTVCVLLWLGGK